MAEIKQNRNYLDKPSRKGRMMNIPAGNQSGGQLTKSGRIYKNDLLDTDLTDQKVIKRKLKGS